MSGRKPSARPGEISVADFDFLDGSVEVARLWVENRGQSTCLIQPDRLADPEMFGMLLVDAVRHGAKAFSQSHGIAEDEALDRIWQGVEMERDDPTSPVETVQNYKKPN